MDEDPELLAEIGRIVVDAALLEYAVARLVAACAGLHGADCDARALEIVKKTGGAKREFGRLAEQRPELRWLANDTSSLLDGRHFIAHAVAEEPAVTDDGEAALFILAPRANDPETFVTMSMLRGLSRLLREAAVRINQRTDAEMSQ